MFSLTKIGEYVQLDESSHSCINVAQSYLRLNPKGLLFVSIRSVHRQTGSTWEEMVLRWKAVFSDYNVVLEV